MKLHDAVAPCPACGGADRRTVQMLRGGRWFLATAHPPTAAGGRPACTHVEATAIDGGRPRAQC